MSGQLVKWLVAFDTDRIKDYVFATNSLKEIRGASAILVEIEDNRTYNGVQESDIVYSAGGGGAFFAKDKEQAFQLVQQIENDFRNDTGNASVTAVAVCEDTSQKDWYKKLKTAAILAMQKKKASKAELTQLPLEPYMRPCASCGQLPAQIRYYRDQSGDLLCSTCYEKRKEGTDKRKGYFKKFIKSISINHPLHNADLPQDLNELGEIDGTGYVGFIKIDGNRMGALFEEISTPEQDRIFSRSVKEKIEDIVYKAISQPCKKSKTLPFEIVLIGGDDIMLFTTVKMALDISIKILHQFEIESTGILQKAGIKKEKLTMSAGVVLCHSNFPIPLLTDIGEVLLKNAKLKAAKVKYDTSTIDFQVVTGSMIDIESARALVPYHRPYTHQQMSKLLQYARDFKKADIPTSQLQMIYEACLSNSEAKGSMAALRMVGRLRNPNQQLLLKKFFNDKEIIEFEKSGLNIWPWSRPAEIQDNGQGKKLFCALVDLLDLYSFIEKGAQDD